MERIEKLEDENHRLHANYQVEHDRLLQTLLDRQVSSFSRSDRLTDGCADVPVLSSSHLEECQDKCFTRLIALTNECYARQFFDGKPNTSRLSLSLSLPQSIEVFEQQMRLVFLSLSPGLLA